ncbi:hypothetical protein [Azospirillum sp. TSO5]|uniref:hypothetical protein n=1 Tax=Azospirillum sp. TSO5 TaxID=716760 RepID=UPI000D6119FE|nr:hypothetical protein [Azospirillum sp. TSO5]PWC96915.1 hypothetical protein TSO5_05625 [Azospirillum sp. TSO5]
MAFNARAADPENREQIAELHRLISRAHAITRDLIGAKVDGLEWVDACLIDAGSDVVGIFNNSEPMSFR